MRDIFYIIVLFLFALSFACFIREWKIEKAKKVCASHDTYIVNGTTYPCENIK